MIKMSTRSNSDTNLPKNRIRVHFRNSYHVTMKYKLTIKVGETVFRKINLHIKTVQSLQRHFLWDIFKLPILKRSIYN